MPPRLAEALSPRALSSSGPQTRNGSVGRLTVTSKKGVWGRERERLRRGRGECGKEPGLTEQVLGSPRLPVSHPQTRPNQSTGPQTHAASHRHILTPRQTPAQTHRVTRAQNQTYTLTQTDTVRHTALHTLRDTVDTRIRHTHTEKHTDTVTCAHVHNTHGQLTALLPAREICLHSTQPHMNAYMSYTAPHAAPTVSHLPAPTSASPDLGNASPRKGSQRSGIPRGRLPASLSDPLASNQSLSLATWSQNSQGVAGKSPSPLS